MSLWLCRKQLTCCVSVVSRQLASCFATVSAFLGYTTAVTPKPSLLYAFLFPTIQFNIASNISAVDSTLTISTLFIVPVQFIVVCLDKPLASGLDSSLHPHCSDRQLYCLIILSCNISGKSNVPTCLETTSCRLGHASSDSVR